MYKKIMLFTITSTVLVGSTYANTTEVTNATLGGKVLSSEEQANIGYINDYSRKNSVDIREAKKITI
jgi:hypothetical protein